MTKASGCEVELGCGAASGASKASSIGLPPQIARATATLPTRLSSDAATSTPSSTTTPGSPTQRSARTRRQRPQSGFPSARWPGSLRRNVEQVLSEDGSAYKPYACADLGITAKKTRPYRLQTNEKIERFHRTLADRWAYARFYTSEAERRSGLPGWLHFYNHHRLHSAIGNKPPVSRLTKLPGHHTKTMCGTASSGGVLLLLPPLAPVSGRRSDVVQAAHVEVSQVQHGGVFDVALLGQDVNRARTAVAPGEGVTRCWCQWPANTKAGRVALTRRRAGRAPVPRRRAPSGTPGHARADVNTGGHVVGEQDVKRRVSEGVQVRTSRASCGHHERCGARHSWSTETAPPRAPKGRPWWLHRCPRGSAATRVPRMVLPTASSGQASIWS